MAVEEFSFIEPELSEVLVAHKINKVRHAAAPWATLRHQVVGTALVGHMRPTISQDESEHEREQTFHVGLGGAVRFDFSIVRMG